MNRVQSLKSSEIKSYLDSISVVACDIDDTLIDAQKGVVAGTHALSQRIDTRLGKEVYAMRQLTRLGLRKLKNEPWEKREEFDSLVAQIRYLQRSFVKTFGLQLWSREAWILIACKKLKISLSPQEVEEARDLYWDAHTKASTVYPDTFEFISHLKYKNIFLVLMTASNSIMKVTKDALEYDPDYSFNYKKRNVDTFSMQYDAFVAGDPYDKPNPLFFDSVETKIIELLGKLPSGKHIMAVGDSPANDLQVPKNRGWKTLLLERD